MIAATIFYESIVQKDKQLLSTSMLRTVLRWRYAEAGLDSVWSVIKVASEHRSPDEVCALRLFAVGLCLESGQLDGESRPVLSRT